jgi:hypothetical protein
MQFLKNHAYCQFVVIEQFLSQTMQIARFNKSKTLTER